MDSVSAAFELLAQQSKASGITDWSVSQVGLSEVFQHIVEQSHAERATDTQSL